MAQYCAKWIYCQYQRRKFPTNKFEKRTISQKLMSKKGENGDIKNVYFRVRFSWPSLFYFRWLDWYDMTAKLLAAVCEYVGSWHLSGDFSTHDWQLSEGRGSPAIVIWRRGCRWEKGGDGRLWVCRCVIVKDVCVVCVSLLCVPLGFVCGCVCMGICMCLIVYF